MKENNIYRELRKKKLYEDLEMKNKIHWHVKFSIITLIFFMIMYYKLYLLCDYYNILCNEDILFLIIYFGMWLSYLSICFNLYILWCIRK